MNFNQEWKTFEDEHDEKNPTTVHVTKIPTISGINLSDFLIFRKWIDYAKGIADPTANLFNVGKISYQEIYNKAKSRGKYFKS